MKKEVIEWFNIKDIEIIRNLPGFIHVHQYSRHVHVYEKEWGLVETDDVIIRYRGTSSKVQMDELEAEKEG